MVINQYSTLDMHDGFDTELFQCLLNSSINNEYLMRYRLASRCRVWSRSRYWSMVAMVNQPGQSRADASPHSEKVLPKPALSIYGD